MAKLVVTAQNYPGGKEVILILGELGGN